MAAQPQAEPHDRDAQNEPSHDRLQRRSKNVRPGLSVHLRRLHKPPPRTNHNRGHRGNTQRGGNPMPYGAIVTVLALLQYTWFGLMVGRAREKYGIAAPATSGNEVFERHFRVHMNTL